MGRGTDMPGSFIHHLSALVAGKDSGEQLVLSIEEASRLSTPPFSSQICCSSPHTAPATLPPALCPFSAPTQQVEQGSQPTLALTKNCWIAVPSITQPSGEEGSQQHSACPHQILPWKHLGISGDQTLPLSKRPALSLIPH